MIVLWSLWWNFNHSKFFFIAIKSSYQCYTWILSFSHLSSIYGPLVIFGHSQISKYSQSKHCHFQTFSKLIPLSLSLLSAVVVILSTRLAVILKFPYLCRYGVSITKEFNWQAGEVQYFDCEKICACALKFKRLK